ncbi:N-6 DNA methylase [Faecalibacillus faecis]|jgi:type I restriction enzyme M protein|uniref:N-6 DNA methylase n=1 Tax=Faecalibacillus faecis TaxID=1982628 RepID=UPI003FD7A12D
MHDSTLELTELCDKVKQIFNIENLKDLKEKIQECVISNDYNKYDLFCKVVDNDLSTDWLQKIFEYYEADRVEKKQDYTPKSLAKLMAKIADDNEVIDMCAGSGALTIQKWNQNKNCNFKLYELDESVISYLLFNLAVRNINAYIYHIDVLSQKIFHVYKLESQNKYSKCGVIL